MDSTRLAVNVAAQEGDINKLYLAIRENPQVLEEIDSLPFVDTPLHIAAKAGHIPFVAEVMKLKPSFSWKLNVEGYPPIHLAQQHGHNSMVIDIISKNKELIRAKARKDRTPLHLASKKGEIQVLIKFLEACPSSIEDVTVKRETALHIAVRCRQYDSLYILVGWLVKNSRFGAKQLESSILNWKDVEGNTALHVSSHQNNLQMVQLLMKSKLLDLQSKNNEGRSALDVATGGDIISVLIAAGASSSVIANVGTNVDVDILKFNITWKSRVITWIERLANDITEEQRNYYLIIATLVLTATYQFALNPPGGVYQANAEDNSLNSSSLHNSTEPSTYGKAAGKAVMGEEYFFLLSVTNEVSFLISIMIIFILMLPTGRVAYMLSLLFYLLTCTYYMSEMVISPTVSFFLGIPLLCSSLFLLLGALYIRRRRRRNLFVN